MIHMFSLDAYHCLENMKNVRLYGDGIRMMEALRAIWMLLTRLTGVTSKNPRERERESLLSIFREKKSVRVVLYLLVTNLLL